MKQKNHAYLAFIFILSLLAACTTKFESNGQDVDNDQEIVDDGEEGGSEFTLETFCERMNDIICRYLTECCTEDERTQVIGSGWIGVNCSNHLNSNWYRDCVSSLEMSVDMGTIELIEAGSLSCETALNNIVSTCKNLTLFLGEFFSTRGSACGDVLVGKVDIGGECYSYYDCIYGYCAAATSQCAAYVPSDGECTNNLQCAPSYTCINGQCSLPSQGGDSPGTCDTNDHQDCELGAWCDGEVCRDLFQTGEVCSGLEQCEGVCDMSAIDQPLCIDLCNGL